MSSPRPLAAESPDSRGKTAGSDPLGAFEPLIARTGTLHRPRGPSAYDCVRLIVARDGTAVLFSEFGERPIRPGAVLLHQPTDCWTAARAVPIGGNKKIRHRYVQVGVSPLRTAALASAWPVERPESAFKSTSGRSGIIRTADQNELLLRPRGVPASR